MIFLSHHSRLTLSNSPGAALFTVFAALAGYSGYLLWEIFMGMDSYEFPLRSYGDMGYRLYGNWMRYLFNILQAIQLILNVGVICVSNGQALSQAAKFRLCFAVCVLVFAIAGFIFGQVRTLQKFGWLANLAVWLNIAVMVISMYAVATEPPNYEGSASSAGAGLNGGASITPLPNGSYPPIEHSTGLPTAGNFGASVNGAMQAVFSYGGAMIFPEFMNEMRRPRDFLKGMWAAQAFIYVVYMVYGLFLYYYQGISIRNPFVCMLSTLTSHQANMSSTLAISVLESTPFKRPAMSSLWLVRPSRQRCTATSASKVPNSCCPET